MRFARVCAVLAGVTALFVASTSFAEDLPPLPPSAPPASPVAPVDDVVLRSGEHVRGTVLELVPKDHVTIFVAGTGPRRIAWPEVDRVVVASVSTAPAPAAKAPVPAPAPVPEPEPEPEKNEPKALVHVTTPKPVAVYRRRPGSTGWQLVCSSPCDKELPVSGTYRVVGNGVAPKELGLPAHPGEAVDITVDPSSSAGIGIGAVLVGLGGVLLYGALIASSDGCSDCSGSKTAGGVALAGLGVAVGGAILLWASVGTDVSASARARRDRASKRTEPALDAFLRVPTWSPAGSTERAAPAVTFPAVLGHAF